MIITGRSHADLQPLDFRRPRLDIAARRGPHLPGAGAHARGLLEFTDLAALNSSSTLAQSNRPGDAPTIAAAARKPEPG